MENRKINKTLFVTSCLIITAMGTMTGCSNNKSGLIEGDSSTLEKMVEAHESQEVSIDEEESDVANSYTDESNTVKTDTEESNIEVSDINMINLPEGIVGYKAETKPNLELQQLIIDYYEIPKEYLETTRYYYNYIDLDVDGIDEIFAVVMGPYTSGTGGSSALWVYESDGKLHVNQDFTLINTPIIISDKLTNGVRELIVSYYGGGAESQYSKLTCTEGFYQRVSDGTMVKNLEGITGTAIIANDILSEIDTGIMGLNLMSK